MEKMEFLTDKFYKDDYKIIEVMNKLIEDKSNVSDMDNYQSGEYLFLEVYDNETNRTTLSDLISDFDSYIAYNKEHYSSDEDTHIGLGALVDIHNDHHSGDSSVYYHAEEERYMAKAEFYNEEEEEV